MTETPAAVYVLTRQGAVTAAKIAAAMPTTLYAPHSLGAVAHAVPFDALPALVRETFFAYRRHVFITAAGIAVRCIAPHIKDKSRDPAVVVLDHHGKNVISLLSGHLGGANDLARAIAAVLGGQAVITTATDTENLPSLDLLAREHGLAIADIRAVAAVNGALLAGRSVVVDDPHNHLRLANAPWRDLFLFTESDAYAALAPGDAARMERVTVTPRLHTRTPGGLVLHPKVLHVGVGCRKNTRAEDILACIHAAFEREGFAVASLAGLASADIKRHEPGLLEAAARLNVPVRFFSAKELQTIPVTAPSPKAREVLGVNGVCEPAAVLAAGENALLRMPKNVRRGVTLAIAQEMNRHV